jgi:uncharacterized membrane protein
MTQEGKGASRHRRIRTSRLESLSDGVFAFAMTLLVLDLAVPSGTTRLLHAIGDQWPSYLGYLVSFATIGAIWLGHSAITEYLEYADILVMRLNLLLLFSITFLPFPTRLMADYIRDGRTERVATTFYGLSLLVTSVLLSLLWRYAVGAGLIYSDASGGDVKVLTDRLTPGVFGYAGVIVLGLFAPVAAVAGYLVIAVYYLEPSRFIKRRARRR